MRTRDSNPYGAFLIGGPRPDPDREHLRIPQRHNIRVLLCGMETPPTHGLAYSIAFHSIFPGLAQQYRIALVPFLLEGVVLTPDLLGADGVHPNAAGAERIAETVWPYLEPLLRQ